jgi:hypothetical protein
VLRPVELPPPDEGFTSRFGERVAPNTGDGVPYKAHHPASLLNHRPEPYANSKKLGGA